MVDIWTPEKRSAVMARIRGITLPERRIRAKLVQHGTRGFKVNAKVGKITPDLIFPKERIAIFVDGCFWHGCPHCYVQPKTNVAYWAAKVQTNMRRDGRQRSSLRRAGWRVIRIWECQLEKHPEQQINRILRLLE